jgi:hypothetical protein
LTSIPLSISDEGDGLYHPYINSYKTLYLSIIVGPARGEGFLPALGRAESTAGGLKRRKGRSLSFGVYQVRMMRQSDSASWFNLEVFIYLVKVVYL